MADQLGPAGKPDPADATTPAEFVDAMARLKRWTGWGYRRLEKQAAAAGQILPRSTLTTALSRPTLPREDLVAGFAIACGCDEAEAARWVAARRRIASAPDTPDTPDALDPPRTAEPVRVVIVAPPWARRRTRVLAAAIVLALAAAAGIAWRLGGSDAPTIVVATMPDQSHGHAAPVTTPSSQTQPPAPTSASSTAAAPPPASGTPPPAPTTITVPGPLATPDPVPGKPIPGCADSTYRHVGDQRVHLPAYGGSADCVLSYGAQGEGVKALQSALINCNNAAYVTMTGVYDQKTWDAIAFIQTAIGANPADGIYRPETRGTLNWAHDSGAAHECARYNGT